MTAPATTHAGAHAHTFTAWRVRRLDGRAALVRYCLDCPTEQRKRAPHHDAPPIHRPTSRW